jgi:hypothetical protein
MIGLLVPPSPWSGRLVAVSAKAVSILHPDGALVSVVGSPSAMESRSMMPAEGFSGFAARSARLLEASWQKGPKGLPGAGWDGKQLLLAPALVQARNQGPMDGPVLAFSRSAVWDPRGRLAEAAAGWSPANGILAAGVALATELRALLAEAYAAGRRAEGLHGSGAFAAGFRRLEAHPDFPAVAVGFGPGTTPAGDDWLAGCLAALDLRAGVPGKAASQLRQKIRDRLEQTTAAGKSLLLGALAGAPPEYLVGLVEAAAGHAQGFAGLRGAVSNCLAHGATSGEDALAGFVYGLETDLESMQPVKPWSMNHTCDALNHEGDREFDNHT